MPAAAMDHRGALRQAESSRRSARGGGDGAPRRCPACSEGTGAALEERLEEGCFYRCGRCGMQYVDPVPENTPVFEDFADYEQCLLSELEQDNGGAGSLTPNERLALRWLRRNVPRGAPVAELCCESGRFLAALYRNGFRPLGTDPLPRHVSRLRERGFTAEVGLADDYRADWPGPSAVVLLESLVRFPAPVELLRSIRRRFPEAPIWCSVPSPRRSLKVPEFDRRLDYPPDHLTRWTPEALRRALEGAGYRGRCGVARVIIRGRSRSWRSRILRGLFRLFLRATGEDEYSLIGIGWPRRGLALLDSEGAA